jgi:hypothetical protein
LLGVSAVRPHDLTQSFYSGTLGTPGTAGMPNTPATAPTGVQANQHLAPWFTPTSRLYRALELLGTRDLMAGTPMGGRVAGKVNPNNVQNLEVWRAICDANTNSTTLNTDTVSDGIFNALTTARTPGGSPGGSDAPLWGMGAPGVPAGDPQYPTLNDGSGGLPTGSWLRENSPPTPGQTMLLANKNAPQAPFGTEAVSKIAGHLSPRSNCFAVWCTVGLFEVTDAGARPMKLGREYDDTLRRRFFCVIDRTNLSLDPANATRQGPKPVWLRFRPSAPINADDPTASGVVPAGPVTLQVPEATTGTANSLSGTYDGTAWTIRQGDTIFIGVGSGVDAGLNQREAVTVQSVAFAPGASSLTITTTLPHAVNDPVCNVLTGNPGPQGTINYASAPYRDTVIPFAMWLPQ